MPHHAGLHIHACRVKIFRWGRVLERAVEGARAKIFETERRELFSGTDVYVEDCGELKKPVPERPQLFGGGRSGFNSAWGRELEGGMLRLVLHLHLRKRARVVSLGIRAKGEVEGWSGV